MSEALVREALAAINRDGVEAALVYFAEDFEGVVPPELSAEPDEYRGYDGLRRYFDLFAEVVDDLQFDVEELVEVAEGALVGRSHIAGRGRGSGIPVEMRVPILIRIRDGKLAVMAAYADWDEALAAAGEPA